MRADSLNLRTHQLMFDYSKQIEAFRDKRVRLSSGFKDKLLGHRSANRKRLIRRLPNFLERVRIGDSNFKPQGSVAMGTIVQTKFFDEEYDIDDGLVISRSQLQMSGGFDRTSGEVREAVRDALKDKRFNRQPKLYTNCIRVFYAEEDEEKHHVDFPVYRKWVSEEGDFIQELANESDWVQSDPTQVNSWFGDLVKNRNLTTQGWGTQYRHLVQLLKRFCRSRKDWLDLLPNGMKLTMLVAEVQPHYSERIDIAFRTLLGELKTRLENSKIIRNLAHPDQPEITRSDSDANVCALLSKVDEALEKLEELDLETPHSLASTRLTWDWIFKSDGFFKEFDEAASAQKSAASEVRTVFDVPWRDSPSWPMNLTFKVALSGKFGNSEHGTQWTPFESNSEPLPKHLYLRFQGRTNAQKPYQVFWQVVNTGAEAINAGALRGGIVASSSIGAGGLQSTSAPGPLRRERTLYTGMHWVECFIVKDGACVARSGPYVVNIR